MAEVVNLRMARKQRARISKARQAEANRAAHGVSRTERAMRNAEAERAERHLDGIKRERED